MDLCWFGIMSGRPVTPAAVLALGWLQAIWRVALASRAVYCHCTTDFDLQNFDSRSSLGDRRIVRFYADTGLCICGAYGWPWHLSLAARALT